MLILLNPDDYQIGDSHYVNKDTDYVIVDTDSGKRSAVKGTSLLARLNKETKSKSYTISNVNYNCKPKIYMDVPLTPPKNIVFHVTDGTYKCNFSAPFSISTFALKKGLCYLALNDICLDFRFSKRQVYMDTINRIFALNNNISLNLNSDSEFRCIILKNITYSNTIIEFDLVFYIWEQVHNMDISESYKCRLNTESGQCIVEDKSVQLLSVTQFAKDLSLNKLPLTDEYKFSNESKLTNYYECPVFFEGRMYKSSEAAYQSAKTLIPELRDKFVDLSPDDAKTLGRQIQDSQDLRPNWFHIQYDVMDTIVRDKIARNKDCYDELIKTKGKMLVEDTTGWHDLIWGRCYCERCRGMGRNYLGSILTNLRKELIGE